MENKYINDDPIIKFTERINCKKAMCIARLSNSEIKKLFWSANEIDKHNNKKWAWTPYLNSIRSYLKSANSKNGIVEKTYKYGKTNYDGRLYVNQFGLQSLQNKIRNYICNDYYNELDIVNCHPSLLVYLCEKKGIQCTTLKHYLSNRDELLKQHNLTKTDILIAINTDANRKKTNNNYYNLFIEELKSIKQQFDEIEKLPKTDNTKNPLSSSINKLLLTEEGLIIQYAISEIGVENVGFPLFDGIYFNKELSIDIDKINKSDFLKEYKHIKFKIKDTTDELIDFELPEQFDKENMEYEHVKKRFEETYFHTMDPMCFWRANKSHDGVLTYKQLSTNDFKVVCEKFKIEEINDKGMVKYNSIYKRWIGDENSRVYENICFLPYGKIDKCPDYVFNTFEGFEINKVDDVDDDDDDDVDIDNFMEFLSNLVGEHDIYTKFKDTTDDLSDKCPQTAFLLKYLAHMFQFPEKRSETIICFKGWTGTGKDTLIRFLKAMMGTKYCGETGNVYDLFKNFNNILDSKIALFMNELEGKDGVAVQEKLKGLCTRETNTINAKHQKEVEQTNFTRLFVCSNGDSPLNVQAHDRRIIVFMCGYVLVVKQSDMVKSKYATDFWNKFNDDLKNIKWKKKIYNQLMDIDLTGFRPDRHAPVTKAYKLLKEKSKIHLYPFICQLYDNQNFEDFHLAKNGKHYINFKILKNKYIDYLTENDMHPDYRIKEDWIKQKLANCNNTFDNNIKKTFVIDGKKTRREYAEFDFKNMVDFIKGFMLGGDADSDDSDGE